MTIAVLSLFLIYEKSFNVQQVTRVALKTLAKCRILIELRKLGKYSPIKVGGTFCN